MKGATRQARIAPLRRPALSRDGLVAVARKIIAAEGYEALSLRRLAKRLGVTAPALYAHVDDKLDLLRAVAASEFDALADEYERLRTPDPIERLRQIAHIYVDYARANPELFRSIFLFPPEHEQTDSRRPHLARSFQVAAEPVAEAMREGRIRKGDHMLTSVAIWSAVHGVANLILMGADVGRKREDALLDTVVDNLLAGLSAPAGRTRRSG